MTDKPAQQPTLVLMAGFGGSGKTTLAHALAARLHWPVLDKDVLKARIIRTSTSHSEESISENFASKLAYSCLFGLAEDLLVLQGLSVILDTSAVLPAVAETANNLIQNANVRLKIILCKATDQTRLLRVQQRNKQDAGRRQLLIDPPLRDDDHWGLFNHLPIEHLIEIDTTRPFDEYLQTALQYLSDIPCLV